MRKNIIIVFCVATLLLFFVNVSFAQGPDKKWGIGARLSLLSGEDDTVQGVKFEPDNTALFEGIVQYLANNLFSMELSVGYSKMDVKAEESGLSIDFGELKQTPIRLTGRLHYWFADSKATLYGGGGIGYYINDFKLSGLVLSAIPSASADADNSFGALDLDLKYVWTKADFEFRDSSGAETVEIDLNGFVAGISLKYCF
jgi:outer membrane protein W